MIIVNIQYDSLKESINLRKLEKFLIKHSMPHSIQKLEQQIKKKCEKQECPKFFVVVAGSGRRRYCEDHDNKSHKREKHEVHQPSVEN